MSFAILTHGRCGSNLLWRTLDKHSQLSVITDVFNRKKWGAMLEERPRIKKPRDVFRYCNGLPVHYSDNKYMDGLFFDLVEEHRLRLIFLKRNWLTRLVSWELSQKTGNTIHEGYGDTQVWLDPKNVLENFIELEAMEKMAMLIFMHKPSIIVNYEDLCKNWNEEMARIQDFIRVKYEPLTPAIDKQDDKPLRDRLQNYDEVRSYISNTPWKRVFEEIDEQEQSQ